MRLTVARFPKVGLPVLFPASEASPEKNLGRLIPATLPAESGLG
jgi:hypothetical protein